MRFAQVSRLILTLGIAGKLSHAQNCPLLGPAYPAATDVASPAFIPAKARFDEALASDARVDRQNVSFAIEIYSSRSSHAGSIYRSFNTATTQNGSVVVGPDTLFRIHSISKVVTVYTMLSRLSYRYWHEPVTRFIPELAEGQAQDVVRNVDWSEVTLGSLASQISGISRDYALGDASTVLPAVPGLRQLDDSEFVRCGSPPLKPCGREAAMQYVLQTWPVAQSHRTPNYSNMAFQLLAYAVENITGKRFPDLVTEQIIEPLNLTRTFLSRPVSETNAVVYDGWDLDFGDEAPTAGYYSTLTDLTALGRSILNSTLLPALTTRKWLKPTTHTSSQSFSLGSPWEILRQRVPVAVGGGTNPATSSGTATSPGTADRARVVDLYTKQGGGDGYTSLLGLSPDHDMGVSILTAGPASSTTFLALRQLFVDIWLPAVEQAARDRAAADLAGGYVLGPSSSVSSSRPSSTAEVGLEPGEPALCISKLVSNGTDVLDLMRQNLKQLGGGGEAGPVRMWLYPVGLTARSGSHGGGGNGGGGRANNSRIAFRGVVGFVGKPAAEDCASWAEGDRLRWGNYPSDLVVFETGADGKATAIEVPILGARLKRVGL